MNYKTMISLVVCAFGVTLMLGSLVLIDDLGCAVVSNLINNGAVKPVSACIFCRIVRGAAPVHMYAQDDTNLLFRSRSGGILAISHEHIPSLKQLNDANVAQLADTIAFTSRTIKNDPQFRGKQYQQAYFHTGSRAGQTVFHIHMHVRLVDQESPYEPASVPKGSNALVLAENQYARIKQGAQDRELVVQIIPQVDHLADLNHDSALVVARSLKFASEFMQKRFPNNDYQTHITNRYDSQGQAVLEIVIRRF